MCTEPASGRTGWQGWSPLPEQAPLVPSGPWHDLTHPFSAGVPRSSLFPAPALSAVAQMPDKPFNVTRLDTVVHVGTHLDSPRHFFADGPGMDEIPLERVMGPGVVIPLTKADGAEITADDLTSSRIDPGDIVILSTGWSRHWGTPRWDHHPHLAASATDWLVARQVRMVAIDFVTPDMAFPRRTPDHGSPAHIALLGAGVLILEQIADPSALAGRRVEVICAPLPLVECDGSPVRVMARAVRDQMQERMPG